MKFAKTVAAPIIMLLATCLAGFAPASRYRFASSARELVNSWNARGSVPHCAVGLSHITNRLGELGALFGLETIRIYK